MKTLQRNTLGALSSVFLAVGLVRIAGYFDPISRLLCHVSLTGDGNACMSCEPCILL